MFVTFIALLLAWPTKNSANDTAATTDSDGARALAEDQSGRRLDPRLFWSSIVVFLAAKGIVQTKT